MKRVRRGRARVIGHAAAIAACLMLGACSTGPSEETLAEIEELQDRVHLLETALREANDNIEEANAQIQAVESYEYGGCDDLRFAVSSLDEIDKVAEP